MPSREPSRKKQQTQLQRIKKAHAKRAASRTLAREGTGGFLVKGSTRRGDSSWAVVRKRSSGKLGDVSYEVIRYSRTKTSDQEEPEPAVLGGPREASVPHGGLFSLGDPTLAKRVEEEIYRSEVS
ncbi:MAG: hypothetical protein M3R38_35480 [Actinomycetota bacterium]|nr:hypothetical protein [Actinomycetota bacterium]